MITALLLCVALQAQDPPLPGPPHEPPPPLDRVVLIGASVTGGFSLGTELNATVSMAEFIDQAVGVPHEPVKGLGSSLLFQDPIPRGEKQIEKALAASPTLVIGADFLFWFAYGYLRDVGSRQRLLERGMKMLERFDCPVVVGDLPDMRPALKGKSALLGGRSMLQPSQIPSPEELKLLNEQIRAWAATRENVYVMEMSRFVEELRSKSATELRGIALDAKAKEGLLQADLLHPTVKGTCVFTLLVFDTIVREGLVPAKSVVWDLEALERGVWKATEAQRERRLERERRREERKRELEERKREKGDGDGGDGGDGGRHLIDDAA